ncbi:hypothetical protein GF374_03675 [Candidatus Woesearchaeota archaeon]|nr:hypothetical protein [Candidatus Woesearchaeota archaeon]
MTHPARNNPHHQRIRQMRLTTPALIERATKACHFAMRNTATGAWLAVALERLQKTSN